MKDDGHEATPEERGHLLPSAPPPPPAIGGSKTPASPASHRPIRSVETVDLVRTAVGLLIGVASTGIEAILAELTARRGGRSERH